MKTNLKDGWAYGRPDDKLPAEIEAVADKVLARQPFGGIITIREYPALANLVPTLKYEGQNWAATRRQIDQLDQVTFGRIRSQA